jgi:hypothetical protein
MRQHGAAMRKLSVAEDLSPKGSPHVRIERRTQRRGLRNFCEESRALTIALGSEALEAQRMVAIGADAAATLKARLPIPAGLTNGANVL